MERKVLAVTNNDLGFVEESTFIDSGNYYYLDKIDQYIPKTLITGAAIYDVTLEPDRDFYIKGSFEDGKFTISTSYGGQETILMIFIRGIVHLAFDRQPYTVPRSVVDAVLEPLTRGIFNIFKENNLMLKVNSNVLHSKSIITIPESIQIMGTVVDVDRSYDELNLDGDDLYGLCDYYAKKIFIVNDSKQQPYSNEVTFLHELFHTILYHMGVIIRNKDHEEIIVEQLALYILQIIRINNLAIMRRA